VPATITDNNTALQNDAYFINAGPSSCFFSR
jgi:hypothetical protein